MSTVFTINSFLSVWVRTPVILDMTISLVQQFQMEKGIFAAILLPRNISAGDLVFGYNKSVALCTKRPNKKHPYI